MSCWRNISSTDNPASRWALTAVPGATYPTLTVSGLTDTLVVNNILGARHVHEGLVNLYAAMPSLHVAWAVWCAAAIVLAARSRWRHLAWLYPMWTTFVIVATANHFFLDAIAGVGILAGALTIVITLHRYKGWSLEPLTDRSSARTDRSSTARAGAEAGLPPSTR